MKIKEIEIKQALSKCGLPGGGLAINPYVGCSHACAYCYARFMKRFTGHTEEWGSFVDVKVNVGEVLEKKIRSSCKDIYIGTVTDPYQPLEKKYQLMRKILNTLKDYPNQVSILTKSDLVVRDIDLLKKIPNLDVNITLNNLDEKWTSLVEPLAVSIERRLKAMRALSNEVIKVTAMVGPYWPVWTNPEDLFREFKNNKVSRVFSESLNVSGGNWIGVEKILINHYPHLFKEIKDAIFVNNKSFYKQAEKDIKEASERYNIPITLHFQR